MFNFLEDLNLIYFIAAIGHAGLVTTAQNLVFQCKKEFENSGFQSPELKKYAELKNRKDRQLAWKRREEIMRHATKKEGRQQELFEAQLHIRVLVNLFEYCVQNGVPATPFHFFESITMMKGPAH